jgi:hypothetical protein
MGAKLPGLGTWAPSYQTLANRRLVTRPWHMGAKLPDLGKWAPSYQTLAHGRQVTKLPDLGTWAPSYKTLAHGRLVPRLWCILLHSLCHVRSIWNMENEKDCLSFYSHIIAYPGHKWNKIESFTPLLRFGWRSVKHAIYSLPATLKTPTQVDSPKYLPTFCEICVYGENDLASLP